MSLPQTPANNQGQSLTQRASQIWLRLIKPHPSVKDIGEFRRAQLLAILTLILTVFFIAALFFSTKKRECFSGTWQHNVNFVFLK